LLSLGFSYSEQDYVGSRKHVRRSHAERVGATTRSSMKMSQRLIIVTALIVLCLSVASDVNASHYVNQRCDTIENGYCFYPTFSASTVSEYNGIYPATTSLRGGPSGPQISNNLFIATGTPTWWDFTVDGGHHVYFQFSGEEYLAVFQNQQASSTYQTRIENVIATTETPLLVESNNDINVRSGYYYIVYNGTNTNAFPNNSNAITDFGDTGIINVFPTENTQNIDDSTFYSEIFTANPSFVTEYPITLVELDDQCYWQGDYPETLDEVLELPCYVRHQNSDLTIPVTTEVTIQSDYFIETSELNTSVSEKNPTSVSFSVAKRPSAQYSARAVSIAQVQGTGTAQTTFVNLENGTYDVLVKFSNIGCGTGLSACPFPLAYVYTEFTVENGLITATGTNEVYTNTNPPILGNEYEDCSLTKLSGCISNSLRFLFIPSDESIQALITTKESYETKIPFVYLSDITNVADEIFNTTQAQTLDVELDLGFGTIPFINEDMIANAPQASLIRQLLSYMLWIAFALGAYRMALGIHNKETT